MFPVIIQHFASVALFWHLIVDRRKVSVILVQDSDCISHTGPKKTHVGGGWAELPETGLAFCADVRKYAFLAILAAFPAHGGVCERTATWGLKFNSQSVCGVFWSEMKCVTCPGPGRSRQDRSWHSCFLPPWGTDPGGRLCTDRCGCPCKTRRTESTSYSASYRPGKSQSDTQAHTSWETDGRRWKEKRRETDTDRKSHMRPEKSTSGSREERLSPGNKGKSQGLRKLSAPDVSAACVTWDAREQKIYQFNHETCTHTHTLDRCEMLEDTQLLSACALVFSFMLWS